MSSAAIEFKYSQYNFILHNSNFIFPSYLKFKRTLNGIETYIKRTGKKKNLSEIRAFRRIFSY